MSPQSERRIPNMVETVVVLVMAAVLGGLVALLLGHCQPVKYGPPPSSKVCSTDVECTDNQHCGYQCVDKPYVCIAGPSGIDTPSFDKKLSDAGKD
jgi:hypothetical protein